ncbi:MAG: single-stranded DNA binding protein [Halodesulfurarchaeum sp.]
MTLDPIQEVYLDLDTDAVDLAGFREQVETKVEEMGGLADEETAAKLIAHDLEETTVDCVDDVTPAMAEASFTAKVLDVGDLRTFERDDPDRPDGQVLNVDAADETGRIRLSFWDEQAGTARDDLEAGSVIEVTGRPKEGYDGIEVSVQAFELAPDVEIDVQNPEEYDVEDLAVGVSDVTLVGEVLGTEPIRTFDRDDGSEGRVANLLIGDGTGRVRVTLWDDRADTVESVDRHDVVEIVDGYVRERDGSTELHVGDRGAVEPVEASVSYDPETTDIAAVSEGDTVDIAGVVRSADPKRTFDRDDGSEGQVRNVRLQDDTDDIRVALWGEKADLDLGPGDEVLFVDAAIQDGWQDDLEASANWQTTVVPLEEGVVGEATTEKADTGLAAFGSESGRASDSGPERNGQSASGQSTTSAESLPGDGSEIEFTGVVVQAGNPIILDDGEKTVTVRTDLDVELGEQVTVAGELSDGVVDPDRTERPDR